jgi:hypothetical protein
VSVAWQSIYSIVQQWNGKSVRSFTHDFKIDKDEVEGEGMPTMST